MRSFKAIAGSGPLGSPTVSILTFMGLSCDDQDHGVTADDFAWDVLPEPQYPRFNSLDVADTGMEVDAEQAAPTFEAFLGAWQWSPGILRQFLLHQPPRSGYGPGRRPAALMNSLLRALYSPSQMIYGQRRLRLTGLIWRIGHS
jgi:hypothetical protein